MKSSEIASVLNATLALPDSARIALGRMAGANMRSAMTSGAWQEHRVHFYVIIPNGII